MIYLTLFLTFLQIGAFTFGGGYAMIPIIQQEVLNHGWMTQGEILDFIAISESTPGPLAVNMSTYIGYQTAGFFGAICATFGVVLPSFIIILLVARVLEQFSKSKIVQGAMLGLKGVVVGLIGSAVISTAQTVFNAEYGIISREMIFSILLFIACFYALMKKVSPIKVIIASGGVAGGTFLLALF